MPQFINSDSNGYIGEGFFTIVFNVQLDAANPPPTNAFEMQINGEGRSVTGVTVDSVANTVTLTFNDNALTAGDIIQFSYSDPTGGDDVNAIQDTNGADAGNFDSSTIVSGARPGPSAPPVPALSSGSDSGALGDGVTDDKTPTLTGTAAAEAAVKLYDTDGTTLLGTATADGAGNWTITSSTLTDGSHTLKVTQTDSENNTSPLSTGLALTIDTAASAPTSLAVSSGSDSGALGDGISNVGTPTITGHAEANADVRLYEGNTLLGSATADGSGNWSVASSALTEGTHTLTAKQTDVAGNVSDASNTYSYTVDTIDPTDVALSSTSVAMSGATNGATIATLSATDATAIDYNFAAGDGTNDADNGKFTISGNALVAAQSLTAGTYHIYLSAMDAAGNEAVQIFAVDVVDAPAVTSIERAGGAAAVAPAAATSITYTVTFSDAVTGVDFSDFTLSSIGGAEGAISNVSGSGDTYTVTVEDLTGNGTLRLDLNASGTGIKNGSDISIIGAYTTGETYTLDHSVPTAPAEPVMSAGSDTGVSSSDAVTSDTKPVFSGSAEANATVTLYDSDDTTVLGTVSADGSGNWEITSTALDDGAHTVTVTQTDAAGNISDASDPLTVIIATSAAAPDELELASASDSGTVGDGLTNVATPTIKGSASSNATVTLYDSDGTTVLGTATANSKGDWSIVSSTLDEGVHTLTAIQTDLADNVSPASTDLELTIDTTAPTALDAPLLATASDSGTPGDGTTNVARPVITGTADADAKVTLYDSNGTTVLGTTSADGSGNWSITSASLSVGAHTLTVKQSDAAGNASAASTALELTIEARPSGGGGGTPTVVDGVPVTQQPITLPGGGSGTLVQIPIVPVGRDESSGSAGVADIPLASAGGSNLLVAQVAPGFGLSASGGASTPAGSSVDHLIQAILASTPNHDAGDQAHLTGNGTTFLNALASTVPLLIQNIVPVSGPTAPAGALTLTGTSNASQHTALVIDATGLAPGSVIALKSVDFAAIVGAVNVNGDTAGQILTGDAASQQFTVGAGLDSAVFSGGGDDTLAVTPAPPAGEALRAQTLAATPALDATTILHGGLGEDSAVFSGAAADYTLDVHDAYIVVSEKADPSSQAILVNVERLEFDDTTVAVENRAELESIAVLYQNVFGRQADMLGFDFFGQAERSGASLGDIAVAIINSPESQGRQQVFNGNAAHDVELLYQAIFDRTADTAGAAYWVDAMQHGWTLEQVADGFLHSAEMVGQNKAPAGWDFTV